MGRLTFDGLFCDIAMCKETPGGTFCEDGACSQRKVWERLKEYEDMEEQGRLVVMPCKVGDTVYRLQRYFNDATLKSEVKIKRCTIESINLDSMCTNDMVFLSFENIGKTVFLTREEAERALAGGADHA